jgi:polysaccharide export outer membrane protein
MMLLALLLLGAQAGPPPAATAPAAPAPAAPAGATTRDYRIGPGDTLRVTVYGHEDLSPTVVVQPAGTFVFPLLGSVKAAGATPTALEALLRERLEKGLIRDPQVSVVVQDYRSQVVFAVGEVTRPGAYPLAGETSVVELLARAGPVSPSAGSEVIVVRPRAQVDRPVLPDEVTGGGKTPAGATEAEVMRVDMREVRAGRLDRNILLRANDTVFVPEAARVFVSGEVRNPGAFPFTRGLTIRQAVSLAGGFTEDASKGSARVVRVVDGETREIKMKVDLPLEPGDTVVVKARLF